MKNATTRAGRRMPEHTRLGESIMSTMTFPMGRRRDSLSDPSGQNPHGLRTVMGFCLPAWQRGLVWSEAQKIAFIESAWRGLNLGTYTYNIAPIGHPLDNLLIDGQQRMNAIECYLADQFPVFGHRWSEVTEVDRRVWSMSTIFASYRTETTDESYLRDYYDMSNFGGTPHAPPAIVDAARKVLTSWDARLSEREQLKTYANHKFWSPSASMVASGPMAELRAALSHNEEEEG